ncbi:nuclear transport factor 2 family protein [Gordonia caeni]|uniref:nuclear transport factor 2 family protein n=1 Tax=Gordonia caeni TaxID=1007097 RepID=UPI0031CF7987
MKDLTSWVLARTAVTAAPGGTPDPAASRESLRDLTALYAIAVDAHDVAALEAMFAPDAVLDRDGERAHGRGEILALLRASMDGFRRMLHTPETQVVHVDGRTGAGIATAHAELVTSRGVVVAAHEYEDAFAVHEGRWVFTERKIRFVYAARSGEYGATLPDEDRVRLPGEPPRAMRGRWFA